MVAMVWDPSRIAPATWPSALAFYRGIERRNDEFRPLRELVEHVMASPRAQSLVCATSGTALLVLPASPGDAADKPDWARKALRLDVDLSGTTRLIPHDPRAAKAATFATDGGGLARAFDRFVEREKWVD
jgi:hypothetical protein